MLAKTHLRSNAPLVELHLSRDVFVTGRQLSGVVTLHPARQVKIRSLVVSVIGTEAPASGSEKKNLLKPTSFFRRDILLSGSEPPRLTSERVSQYWNAFLGRDMGRILSPGEHTYPFSIPLPASLPPSYNGGAGKIEYMVIVRVQFPLGDSIHIAESVPVVFVPRNLRARPMAISYPTADGMVHDSEVKINLELPRRSAELGSTMKGHFSIDNPHGVNIADVVVSLEACEWLRLSEEKELQRERVDSCKIELDNSSAPVIEADFELNIPESAPPSIEGTAISIIWLLKLYLHTDPPVEFKTPVIVYAPVKEH